MHLSAPPTGCFPPRRRARKLLDGDRRAGGLELVLGLLGSLLGDLLEQRLGGAVDQILGLLEAQARDDLADDLDDADLLLAGGLEDDVELRLLLGGLGGRTRSGGSGRDCDRSGGGDLEGLLELLDELRELEQRQFLERVEQVVGGQLGHGVVLPDSSSGLVGWNRGCFYAASSAAFFSCNAAAS